MVRGMKAYIGRCPGASFRWEKHFTAYAAPQQFTPPGRAGLGCGLRVSVTLHSPNRGGFLRLPMLKINRLIRPRVTC